jgi:AAA domain
MGRKKQQSTEGRTPDAPEPFPTDLLQQPKGARIEYFETQCLIMHTRIEEVCRTVMRSICMPGDDMLHRGLGSMVLVIGPTRVGKTKLIELLEKELLKRARERMLQDPSYMPFASITTDVGEWGRFDWMDYYPAVLEQLHDPFLRSSKNHWMPARDVKNAMIEALLQRKTQVVIVDEAHHLAKAGNRGQRLHSNLDHLKYFENKTGVSHVLVGTYAMRPFRKVSAQLALRTIDVHFSRYDATKEEDRIAFKSALWALQRQLPVQEEPQLRPHWEFLYARSNGCIGALKQHLNQALRLALEENAKTVMLEHLKKTAPSKDKVDLALEEILNGEADLAEADDADEDLLKNLGLIASNPSEEEKNGAAPGGQEQAAVPRSQRGHKLKPGQRALGRDPIGTSHEAQDRKSEVADRVTG